MDQHLAPTGFGTYIRNAIHEAGFATPTQFARSVGIDPSVVLRWISEEQRPTIRSIERIAPILRRGITEMVLAAYPDRLNVTPPTTSPRLHPLAYELGRMLAPDSPISARDREALEIVLERLVEPYRRDMRRRRSA